MAIKVNILNPSTNIVEEKEIKYVRYAAKLSITKIYQGAKLLWSLITSCFGSGVWVQTSKWSDSEMWKN